MVEKKEINLKKYGVGKGEQMFGQKKISLEKIYTMLTDQAFYTTYLRIRLFQMLRLDAT